jgi:ABC-type sulfate/molybdate transport systems ATPase subunit
VLDCRFTVRLPDLTVEVDLQVGQETVALVGRSGAGKTTTLNAIAGLREPASGRIALDERVLVDVAARTWIPPEGRRIGYVFQQYALFPHLDVAENVAFGLFRRDRDERGARVREALAFVGLTGFDRARPSELSGGERQRAAIARALVTDPRVLLLDEPLAAFDAERRARMRLELRSLIARLAIPTIVVSHDFDDARVLGDRIAAMQRGHIIQTGTASELAAHPADAFVAALTGTNLVAAPDGASASRHVAFDPWRARISRTSPDAGLRWQGAIVDIRPFGAVTRIAIRCADDVLITVDVEAAGARSAGYAVGDVVFAWVPEDAARERSR